jgi:DNA repair protein RadC
MGALENLRIIHLSKQGNVVDVTTVTGKEHAVELPIAMIVRDVARHGTHALLLSHSHPSGDATPSASDLCATRQLAMVLRALNVRLHDHIIDATTQSLSFRNAGLL